MQQGSFTAVREKNFQAWWGGMATNVYDDYWEYFHSKNAADPQTNNFWGYANPEMDKLLDAFRATADLATKADLDKKIQRMVDQEALVVPNYYVPYFRGGTWKWVRFPAWLDTKYHDDFFEPVRRERGLRRLHRLHVDRHGHPERGPGRDEEQKGVRASRLHGRHVQDEVTWTAHGH